MIVGHCFPIVYRSISLFLDILIQIPLLYSSTSLSSSIFSIPAFIELLCRDPQRGKRTRLYRTLQVRLSCVLKYAHMRWRVPALANKLQVGREKTHTPTHIECAVRCSINNRLYSSAVPKMGQFSKISSSNSPGFQDDFTFEHKSVFNRECFYEIQSIYSSNKAPGWLCTWAFACVREWISAFIIHFYWCMWIIPNI